MAKVHADASFGQPAIAPLRVNAAEEFWAERRKLLADAFNDVVSDAPRARAGDERPREHGRKIVAQKTDCEVSADSDRSHRAPIVRNGVTSAELTQVRAHTVFEGGGLWRSSLMGLGTRPFVS